MPSTRKTVALIQSFSEYLGNNPSYFSLPTPVTEGNLLIVCVSSLLDVDAPLTDLTITDDKNHIWTRAETGLDDIYGTLVSIYHTVANGNHSPKITIRQSGQTWDIGGSIYEYAGLMPIVNNSNVTVTGATITPTGTALVTTKKSVILAMASQEDLAGVFTACGGGFTLRNKNSDHIDAVADYQNAPAGSYSAIFNFNFAKHWVVLQVAFEVIPDVAPIPEDLNTEDYPELTQLAEKIFPSYNG